jgi:hypothetical protein
VAAAERARCGSTVGRNSSAAEMHRFDEGIEAAGAGAPHRGIDEATRQDPAVGPLEPELAVDRPASSTSAPSATGRSSTSRVAPGASWSIRHVEDGHDPAAEPSASTRPRSTSVADPVPCGARWAVALIGMSDAALDAGQRLMHSLSLMRTPAAYSSPPRRISAASRVAV